MRTKTLLLAVALSAAGIATSLAQSNVYSLNVVGYVNKDIQGTNRFTLVENPLDSGTNTLNGVLASFLPASSRVLTWNGSGFDIYTRTATGWLPATGGTRAVAPGEGFFIQSAAGSPGLTVTFVGEVKQGTLTNPNPLLNNLRGSMFPIGGPVGSPSLQMTNVTTSSRILTWNLASQGYDIYTKTATGWLPPGNPQGPTINVADGFFINTAGGTFDWVMNQTVQ
jgi:hypothetical protein